MGKRVNVDKIDDQADFHNIFFNGSFDDGFLFRGQANASHSLTPGVARNSHLDIEPGQNTLFEWGNGDEGFRLRTYEFRLLRDFIRGCDISGTHIPGDGPELRESFKLASKKWPIPFAMTFPEQPGVGDSVKPNPDWPRGSDYPLIIMAQHHGLPTRLLDWTRSAYAAMYFAAVGGMHRMLEKMDQANECRTRTESATETDDRISVWAINAKKINALGESNSNFCVLETPSSFSVNITPQQGCFSASLATMASREDYELDKEESLAEHIVQYTLPIRYSADIYRHCANAGYTGAKLFPGQDGAAKHAKEMQLLRMLSHYQL